MKQIDKYNNKQILYWTTKTTIKILIRFLFIFIEVKYDGNMRINGKFLFKIATTTTGKLFALPNLYI